MRHERTLAGSNYEIQAEGRELVRAEGREVVWAESQSEGEVKNVGQ